MIIATIRKAETKLVAIVADSGFVTIETINSTEHKQRNTELYEIIKDGQ
jgi:hypothetical protein